MVVVDVVDCLKAVTVRLASRRAAALRAEGKSRESPRTSIESHSFV